MALRSQSLSSKFKSMQRSYSSMTSSLSSYSKTLQRRTQSAEDKIIDDNFSNGLISTEAYIRELQDRQTRTYLTPLQRTNLGIKIRDTQEKYQDEQVQTAYQNGGFINGQKIDDSYMLAYEKSKLEKMDANSTAYQQQAQKVQTLQDKLETKARKDLRTQRELEIAQTPAYTFETLRAKQQMYEELATEAQNDGDTDAYKSYLIQATNYKNAADKAELGYNVNKDVQKLNEDRFVTSQEIKYGEQTGEQPTTGSKQPGAVSAPVPGSQALDSVTPTANIPEANTNTPEQQVPTQQEDILDKLENMSWGDLTSFYNEDENKRLANIEKSASSKKKSLETMDADYKYYNQIFDKYLDAMNNSTDPDERDKYWAKASSASEKSQDLFNKIQQTEAELETAVTDYQDKTKTLNQSVANRILSEAKVKLQLDKAELDKALQEGSIDSSGFIDGQVGYVADYMRFLNVKKYVFNDIYNDPKEVDQIDTEINKYNDDMTKTEAAFNNKWAYAGVVSPEDGLVKLENVQKIKDQLDEKGQPMFDKLYQKVGNAFAKVEYKDNKGNTLTTDEISKKTPQDLEKYRKIATIWRKLTPDGPRVQTITEFGKGETISKISVRDDKGNVQPYFEAPKKEGFFQKAGNALLGAAAWLQTNVAEPVANNIVKPAVQSVGNAMLEDKQNTNNFLRSTFGQPAQQITSNLRSMKFPELMPVAYAAEGQMALQGVPEEYTKQIIEASTKYNVRPEVIAGLLNKESMFDPNADNGQDRGLAQINRSAHPEISDQQALDPSFAIDFVGKELGRLKEATGSEFDALRAYNGGLSGYDSSVTGWDGKRTVSQITREYANDILGKAKEHTPTVAGMTSDLKPTVAGLRSQKKDNINPNNINYAGTIQSGMSLGPNPKPVNQKPQLRSQVSAPKQNPIQQVASAVEKKVNDVKNTVNNTKNTVKAVKTAAPVIKAVAAPAISKVVNSNPTLKSVANTVNTVKKVVDTGKKLVTNPVQTVKEAAKNAWDNTKKKVSNVVSGIRSLFKK